MKHLVLKFNEVDSDGDIFTKDSIILTGEKVHVTKDFDISRVVGMGELSIEEDGVYSTIEFSSTVLAQKCSKIFPNSLHPAIGYICYGENIKIMEIGLCVNKEKTPLKIKGL